MPVKQSKDNDGHRLVEMEFEVPGTPEQVWEAIATGPGISAWFVPSEVDTREGGAVAFHLAPGVTSTGKVTAWQPPRRFAYEEPGWSGDAPPLATEFIVESRDGGTCTVRIVHSLFTSEGDWDDELGGMEVGWTAFIGVLRIYLANFAGMRAASARPTGTFAGSHGAAQTALREALGLTTAQVGDRVDTAPHGAPSLAGTVERVGVNTHSSELLLRVQAPAPGVALIGTYVWDQAVQVAVSLYFYGDEADILEQREGAAWQAWIDRLCQRPTDAGA